VRHGTAASCRSYVDLEIAQGGIEKEISAVKKASPFQIILFIVIHHLRILFGKRLGVYLSGFLTFVCALWPRPAADLIVPLRRAILP
jgi:hypothetical protein